MSAHLSTVLLRILPIAPGPGTPEERERETYRRVIDRTAPRVLAAAMTADYDFDVSDFDVDDVDFHDDCSDAIAAVAANPSAITAARERLYAVVDSHVVGYHGHRADIAIGDVWVAIYAGQSCGDEPFEGYGGVCALAMLPELGVDAAFGMPAGLRGEIRGSIFDPSTDPKVLQWSTANTRLVDDLVAEELEERAGVIADLLDSALSGIRADIRDAVIARIEQVLETADA